MKKNEAMEARYFKILCFKTLTNQEMDNRYTNKLPVDFVWC